MRLAPFVRTVVLAVLAVLAGSLAGCGGAGPETGVSVGDVWENADSLAGDEVTISSRVQRILSDRAFVLGGTEGGDPLLVVHDGTAEILSEAPYRVTGVVHQALDIDEVVDIADEPLHNTIYETYGEDPYLEATRIDVIEGMVSSR